MISAVLNSLAVRCRIVLGDGYDDDGIDTIRCGTPDHLAAALRDTGPEIPAIIANGIQGFDAAALTELLTLIRHNPTRTMGLRFQVGQPWQTAEVFKAAGRCYRLRYHGAMRGSTCEMIWQAGRIPVPDGEDHLVELKRRFPWFTEYDRRFAGRTAVIVGKGQTDFNYEDLARFAGPVVFINDAVALEDAASASVERFFFGHDAWQIEWLQRGIASTAVLPLLAVNDAKITRLKLSAAELPEVAMWNRTAVYEWGGWFGDNLGSVSRDDVISRRQLCVRMGTIHTAIHFVWFTGCKKIVFIGCDGICQPMQVQQYDARIPIESHSTPGGRHIYGGIRRIQDWMCETLGLETEYIGTPEGAAVYA